MDGDRTSITKLPRFHGKRGEDYGIWRLRLRAACRMKGVWNLVDKDSSAATTESSQSTTLEQERHSAKLEKASAIIISALGNSPLRVVAEADDDPARMLQLLDARYASNRTVSRIAVQTQLFRMRYTGQDMSRYIDEYTTLFNQLEFMGKDIAIQEAHKAPMLLASIDPSSDLEPTAAALRTKDASDLTWEYVATTLIDEYNARQKSTTSMHRGVKKRNKRKFKTRKPLQKRTDDGESCSDASIDIETAAKTLAAAVQGHSTFNKNGRSNIICDFCERRGHTEDKCFLNPDNPENKLSSRMKDRMMMAAGSRTRKGSNTVSSNMKETSPKLELAGTVVSKSVNYTKVVHPKDNKTYLDSGATSHVFHSKDSFVPGSLKIC